MSSSDASAQLSLFPIEHWPTLSRRSDPETSSIAAKKLVTSGVWTRQMRLVYWALCRFPGRTAAELADLANIPGLDRYAFSRRLPDLEKIKAAEKERDEKDDPITRRCDITGNPSVIWWPNVQPELLRQAEEELQCRLQLSN